ncbi:DUF1800 domain-containing protein [Lewinella cohaerens]|uniref:DUF1800 domain-containing protein n=1 Tax=Lewinella cohaerens TaxID=70995 RepID=UPI00035F88EE|nr:DUF1800 domain-containing protein [Lewinella cohaerens]
MDRNTALAGRRGRQQHSTINTFSAVTTDLEPYAGVWEQAQAAHLLRRTTFGPNKATLQLALDQGLDATILQLFTDLPLPEPPRYYDTEEGDDPNVLPEESWINMPLPEEGNVLPNRSRSLQAWTMGLLLNEEISIREQLCLFWHNHFAINNSVNDPRFWYRYITTIRGQAWGNFRQLCKDITIDPCMLRFLNGNQNEAGSPNENYARELLELYTVGKGPFAGPGDYTTFTEQDVEAMARVLTGWTDTAYQTTDPEEELTAVFQPEFHDVLPKQLSARFGGAVIADFGEEEYAHLIDVIFAQDEVARHICRKLYRWFVYYKIDEMTEAQVILPLAQMLIDNDYEIAPVLQVLLRSNHFYSILNQGPMIKHPIQFVLGPIRQCGVAFPEEWQEQYVLWQQLHELTDRMDMAYYDIPEVAGWKAYYQQPLFYRNWINSISLQQRSGYVRNLVVNGYTPGEITLRMDPLAFIATLEDPLEPNVMIAEIATLLLPQPLETSQLTALKEILIPGLPDFEWTLEYGNYLGSPDDETIRQAVESKLQDLFVGLFNMAEFHLS